MSKLWLIISASLALLLSFASVPLLNNNLTGFFNAFSIDKLGADLIVYNGTIYTSDDSLLYAESMAIRYGRIIRVGNYSSIKDLAGPGCRELNLKGKIVVPGFIDSHVHLIFGGLQMARVELREVKTKDQFVNKVKEAVKNMKQGSWLLGGGWNNDFWGGELPMASWIDDITPHNPVWLSRMDGHMGLANTYALKVAGIFNYTNEPEGGVIVKSNDNEPTGLLIDSAMKLILSCIPEVSVEERREALLRASNLALMRGVTTVVDMGRYFPGLAAETSWEDYSDVYTWADSFGKMLIRVCLFFPMETWARLHEHLNEAGPNISEKIYFGGLKAFADGSLGSNSALFHEPYVGEPDNFGLEVADMKGLHSMIVSADKAGLQVTVHAIGDKANSLLLDMYASVVSRNGIRDRRFRIEHAQHLAPGTASRFGEQAVVASVQPDHMLDDADSAIKKIGFERAEKGSYLFQSLLAGGATLAFGSDWPVADINPLRSMRTAIKRTPPGWEHPWAPSECMNLDDALKAHTIWAAYSCFLDKDIGSLSPGKLADFVVVTADSWEDFTTEGSVSVEATYVGGNRAFP
ncbi:OLC1v1024737C1 [Oldenlandia corymbosa var. corymbosa]|uniref:OLC1v1024737C1 n=1 Tax=Oldenlandia corymbosa var. corymbosa TaxID=529605 RepID=A0AAV1C3X3_OLDCO|nr:OLC1v1024737C1 [Oldenlandia corymbosa var. corymbosa]